MTIDDYLILDALDLDRRDLDGVILGVSLGLQDLLVDEFLAGNQVRGDFRGRHGK